MSGTEVSEKLNGLHGFLSPRKTEDVEVVDKRRTTAYTDVKRLLFISSNLIIKPHPEKYLADRTRKPAAKRIMMSQGQRFMKYRNVK